MKSSGPQPIIFWLKVETPWFIFKVMAMQWALATQQTTPLTSYPTLVVHGSKASTQKNIEDSH